MRVSKENKKIKNVKFADNNKNEKLENYISDCQKGDFKLLDVKIVRAIHFDKKSEYKSFSENLLADQECLSNLGDKNKAAAVYLNEKLMFIVITEGYNYARYVGIE